MSSFRKTGLYLIVLLLVPVLVYVAHEVQSLSTDEALMREIYERQLDAMLYSVNQHAWDMADSWAGMLQQTVFEAADNEDRIQSGLQYFLEETPTVLAVHVTDSLFVSVASAERGDRETLGDIDAIRALSAETGETVSRLFRLARSDYRQLHPLVLFQDSDQTTVALLFASVSFGQMPKLVSMLLDTETFVQNILEPKMHEVARERFVVILSHEGQPDPIFSTAELPEDYHPSADAPQRNVWLYPDYIVSIQTQGRTIEGLIRGRFIRSLILISLLAIALILGVWMVYRNVRREVELANMKSTFVSNVSHELRTPLALIRMFAETLEMDRVPNDEKRKEYYNIIHHETERLSRLVNNILNFSHIEAGKKQYAFLQTDLNGIVRGVLDTYAFNLKQNRFDVHVDLFDTLPAIRADEEALTEAIINLVDNAIKYSMVKGHEERTIEIKTGVVSDDVYVEIADRGIGISTEENEKIFSPFYRIQDGLVQNVKGTGLGLALVKHIIEAHDGRITVTGKRDQGSRFRLIFNRWENLEQAGDTIKKQKRLSTRLSKRQ